MQKSLTITLDEEIYEGLHKKIGEQSISEYIESLLRSHITELDLEEGYAQMALDEESEAEAMEWIENLIGDVLAKK
jgi:predicted CopG family antitoxin